MGTVKINDVGIARFCYAKLKGLPIEALEGCELERKDKETSFGEYNADGSPRWAVSVYNFKENDCKLDLVVSLKGLMTLKTMKKMAYVTFDYIFNQCALRRCSTTVRESNLASIRITKAFGFKVEGFKRKAYQNPEEDLVMFGMLKEECLWLGDLKNE